MGVLASDVCTHDSMDGSGVLAEVGTKVALGDRTEVGVTCVAPPHADKSKYKMTKILALQRFFILIRLLAKVEAESICSLYQRHKSPSR